MLAPGNGGVAGRKTTKESEKEETLQQHTINIATRMRDKWNVRLSFGLCGAPVLEFDNLCTRLDALLIYGCPTGKVVVNCVANLEDLSF